MGDGFSRTGAGIGTGVCATGAGGGAACLGASRFTTSRVGTSCGFTAKYTIPEASTAPVAKADTSFQFKFGLPIRTEPSALIRLNARRVVYVSERDPLK
jgi:hypothetical protein